MRPRYLFPMIVSINLFLCVSNPLPKPQLEVECRMNKASAISKPCNQSPAFIQTYFNLSNAYRVVCSNFGHPALTSSFQVYALCICCRHTTKITNHDSKAETILKLTVDSQLLPNYFFRLQKSIFVNDEVRAGCLKLGHTTLRNIFCLFMSFQSQIVHDFTERALLVTVMAFWIALTSILGLKTTFQTRSINRNYSDFCDKHVIFISIKKKMHI